MSINKHQRKKHPIISTELIHLTHMEEKGRLVLTLEFQCEWTNLSNIRWKWFETIQQYDKLIQKEQTAWNKLLSLQKSELANSKLINSSNRTLQDEMALSEAFKALSHLPSGWFLFGEFLNRLLSGLPLVGSDMDIYYSEFNYLLVGRKFQAQLDNLQIADIVTSCKLVDETGVDIEYDNDMLFLYDLSHFRLEFKSGVKINLFPKIPTTFDFDVNLLAFNFDIGLRITNIPICSSHTQFCNIRVKYWIRILNSLYTKTARLVHRQPERVTFEPLDQHIEYIQGPVARESILRMMISFEKLKKIGFRVMDFSPPVSTEIEFCSIEQDVPTTGLMVRPNCGHIFSLVSLTKFCSQTGPSCSLCPVCRQPLVFDLRSGI